MGDEGETDKRMKPDSSKAWAIIAVVVVVVGAISVPIILISLEVEITGQVVDAVDEPIPGATVSTWRGSAVTDANGRYSLKALGSGQITVLAEAERHWSQKKIASGGGDGGLVADFVLIDDVVCYVPLGVVFLDLKTDSELNGSIDIQSNPLTSGRWVQIGDFAPDGRKDFRIEFGEYGSSSSGMDIWFFQILNASSFIETTPVIVSGVYGDTPGECENCYVKSWNGVGLDRITLDAKDYLSPEIADEEYDFNSDYGSGRLLTNAPTGIFQLDHRFDAEVSVLILGKQFNCSLPVIFGPVSDGQAYITVELYSMGNNATTVSTLVEGGHILHIWEVGA
jgi:hypothetical protein